MLSIHVGNVGSIESIMRPRVSLIVFACFHSITLLVQVLAHESKRKMLDQKGYVHFGLADLSVPN